MNSINKVINNISALDSLSMDKARNRQNHLLKPKNALGKLEEITIQLAGIYKTDDLPKLKKAIICFASDNGVYEENVSKDKQELTAMHFPNFLKNYSAIGSICEYTNTKLIAIDVGINTDKKLNGIIDEKITKGTKNMTKERSMTKNQAIKSINVGIKYANTLINEGYNIISIGEMGIANTTPATAIITLLKGIDAKYITGNGSGIDENRFKNKVNSINNSIKLLNPDKSDYIDILSSIGGFETGAMLGVILECSHRRIPVILDGIITYSAMLLAYIACINTFDYLFFSHLPKDNSAKYFLDIINHKKIPYLDLSLSLGEGYGAVLFSQIIESAIYSYKTMKTFEEVNMKI